jgi:hypothetical protein
MVSILTATIPFPDSQLNPNPRLFKADSDNDGIENSLDSCPESPLPTWSNQSVETMLNCETCGRTGMDVKFDSQNNTHVVYSGTNQDSPNEHNEGGMSFLKYAIHDGHNWNSSYVSLVTETDYENLSEGGNQDGIGQIIDTNSERPLLRLDSNDLPHIVYYTYSANSDEDDYIQNLRYATYQEIEIGAGYNWQKSTIAQRNVSECDTEQWMCNDIAGFELDSNNQPHIVYSSLKLVGSNSNFSFQSTLDYAVSDDWVSWETTRIYTADDVSGTFSDVILDASMTLDSQKQVNIIALIPGPDFDSGSDENYNFEIMYLKYDGENIIQPLSIYPVGLSISSASLDGGLGWNYWFRTSLSITVDSEDLIHMGYIDSLSQFIYATLEFDGLEPFITTSIIDTGTILEEAPIHSYYDLTLVIEPDGTPHALYTSFLGRNTPLPDGETLDSLDEKGFSIYSFYSVFEDGEWNRLYIGGVMGLPGLAVNTHGLTTLIHSSSHGNDNWSGVSLMKYSPIDSDDDGDGCMNFEDHFPTEPSEHIDSDGDGVGDNADVFPNDITETSDTDGDGFGDESDAFPTYITQWADYDGDGFGDNYANSSWNAGFTMPGEYVPFAFRQDACPLLAGTSYLGIIHEDGIVIYGCPDTDGDGYADILESVSNEPEQVSEKGDGFLGIDLDLIGIALSLMIPLIAITIGWYYSTRKRRNIENLIEVMKNWDNPLDLTTWFDSVSTDAILSGEINHVQLELLRTHYRRHHDYLASIPNTTGPLLPKDQNLE